VTESTPDKILQISTGYWASGILASAAKFKIFDYLDSEPLSAGEIAEKAGISPRGAQAVLDGLLGLQLVHMNEHGYCNAADASEFLVTGKQRYLGGYAQVGTLEMARWVEFSDSVQSGKPYQAQSFYEVKDLVLWEALVTAIAPLAFPPAQASAKHLDLGSKDSFHMLDVGGGAGVYSAVWLGENKAAKSTQFDWGNVNSIARKFVANFGVGDRFETRDGNLLEDDFGDSLYDFAVFSHMAHGLSENQNREALKKFRKAIKPGGTLVLADFVLDEKRQGHPMVLLFFANMLSSTAGGQTYRDVDYRLWFQEAGFESVEIQSLDPLPVTLIYGS